MMRGKRDNATAATDDAANVTPEGTALAKADDDGAALAWPRTRAELFGLPDEKAAAVEHRRLATALLDGGSSKCVEQFDDAEHQAAALVHGIGPRDSVEAMLASQLTATHAAAMRLMGWAAISGPGSIELIERMTNLAVKLSRTHAALADSLGRHRSGGMQVIRIEKVSVADGGQAVIAGNVTRTREGEG